MMGYIDASRLVTIRAGLGRRADWWMRRWVRLWSESLARSKPEGMEEEVRVSCAWSASRSWAV